MSEHVLDWIGALHDGELHGAQRRQVEAHLATCADCQAELAALHDLSMRLQTSLAMPTRTPPEQFVAQVRLQLTPRSAPRPGRERLRQATGLWLPLGVLALWALGQTVLMVTGLAMGLGAVPVGLPPLPGLGAPPLLAALAQPAAWRGWLALLVLNAGMTAAAAVLVGGSLAGWWAAHQPRPETKLAASGLRAGR